MLHLDTRHLRALLGLVCWLVVSSAWPQASRKPATPPPASPPARASDQLPALSNPLSQVLAQQGIRKCLGRSEQLSQFLAFSPLADGALLLPAPGEPDQRNLAISFELRKPDLLSYVSLNLMPGAPGAACGAAYDAVSYWPAACPVVAQQVYGAFQPEGAIRQDIAVLSAGPASKVFLMSAGSGCVSIKREVLLQ